MSFIQKYKPMAFVLGVMLLGFSGTALAAKGPMVEVVMNNNGYDITSGGSSGTMTPGFSLTVGQENVITLINKDTTAHDFVSKAFTDMNIEVVGKAEEVQDGKATGYRVMPGDSVKLKMTPKVGKDFSGSWDVFYCDIHGKDNMKGEVIVADTRTGTGAF